jgi:large subunit ribosomal protein L20
MRIKRGPASHHKHLKIRQATKGMTHSRRRSIRMGRQGVIKALQYAYRDRRNRKRTNRNLWNARINAAVRSRGLSYSQFIHNLKLSKIDVNRKMLADLAINEPVAFEAIVAVSKNKS